MTDDRRSDTKYVAEISPGTSASTTVIEAVAALADCSPFDIEPLYTHIDPDALDTMIAHQDGGSEPTVEFAFDDYLVAVTPEQVKLWKRSDPVAD